MGGRLSAVLLWVSPAKADQCDLDLTRSVEIDHTKARSHCLLLVMSDWLDLPLIWIYLAVCVAALRARQGQTFGQTFKRRLKRRLGVRCRLPQTKRIRGGQNRSRE